jgi:crotonobetainyl-CoA:carnitine CoA-transferase CaiB-like acyl-CoA transferase
VVKGVAVEPSGAYRAADGHLVLAAYVPKHWQALTTLLGRADLAADPRFADQRSRTVHSVELRAELEKEFAARTVDDWTALLQAAGLMAVRANTWSDVVRSPVFADSGLTVETECDGRTVTTLRTPARYSDFDAVATGPVPGLGEHTGTVR